MSWSGTASHERSALAPMGVRVRSTAQSRLPSALPGQGGEDLQRPDRRLVHRKVTFPHPLRDPGDLRQRRRLVDVKVIEDRPDDPRRRMPRRGDTLDPPGGIERPRRGRGQRREELPLDQPLPPRGRRGSLPLEGDELRGGEAEEGVGQRIFRAARLVVELAGGRVERRVREGRDEAHRREEVVPPRVEAFLVEHQPRGDHLGHLPPEDPLLPRLLDLLADGHLASLADQLREVGVARVVRHAAHGDVRFLVPGGQGDIEEAGGPDGVLEEHLVEVAHPEEDDAVAEPRLDLHVLPHRGGQLEGHRLWAAKRRISTVGGGRTPGTGARGSPAAIREGPACRGPTS